MVVKVSIGNTPTVLVEKSAVVIFFSRGTTRSRIKVNMGRCHKGNINLQLILSALYPGANGSRIKTSGNIEYSSFGRRTCPIRFGQIATFAPFVIQKRARVALTRRLASTQLFFSPQRIARAICDTCTTVYNRETDNTRENNREISL